VGVEQGDREPGADRTLDETSEDLAFPGAAEKADDACGSQDIADAERHAEQSSIAKMANHRMLKAFGTELRNMGIRFQAFGRFIQAEMTIPAHSKDA
jgi:hypothetical protein